MDIPRSAPKDPQLRRPNQLTTAKIYQRFQEKKFSEQIFRAVLAIASNAVKSAGVMSGIAEESS